MLKTIAHRTWCDFVEKQKRRTRGSGDTAIIQLLNSEEAQEDFFDQIEKEWRREMLEKAMVFCRVMRVAIGLTFSRKDVGDVTFNGSKCPNKNASLAIEREPEFHSACPTDELTEHSQRANQISREVR